MRSTLGIPASCKGRAAHFSFCFGLAVSALTFQTSPVAFQDIADLTGQKSQIRWLVHAQQPAGASVASLNFSDKGNPNIDPITTAGLSPEIELSETVKLGSEPERVNRKIKGGRVVQTTAKQAPKDFSAGSVLERHSVLRPTTASNKYALSFVKPKPAKEAFEVASLFHVTKPKKNDIPANLPVVVASLVKQSESSILSYAPEEELEYSPFSAVLVEEKPIKILPKLNKDDHAWADDPLPKNSFSKRQQRCLAQGIYFEARGEPVKGQAAVSQVILNRVRNPHYPNSICGVVYQNKHWHNRCQFSFACDRIRDRVKNKRLYDIAQHVAAETTAGRIWLPEVGSSTHYHATYVNPRWNRRMKRVGKIGLHIFYRTFGGGWS
ncbi:MAG: cell wall hydrolase [Pseudomonadota bacterium]